MTKQTKVVQLHKHRKVKNDEPRWLEIGPFDGPSGAEIYWRQIVGIPMFTGWFYRRSRKTATSFDYSVWGPFETREKAEADAHRTPSWVRGLTVMPIGEAIRTASRLTVAFPCWRV